MKNKKKWLQLLHRGIIKMLVVALLAGNIAPMPVSASEAEYEVSELEQSEILISEQETIEENQETKETSEQESEKVLEEDALVDDTESWSTDETEERTTEEGITEEKTTEGVIEEETIEPTTTESAIEEETTEDETQEKTTEEMTEEGEKEEITTEEITEEMTEEGEKEEITTETLTEEIEEQTTEVEHKECIYLVLHTQGGSCEQTEIVIDSSVEEIILPDCFMEGYEFAGWFLDEECTIPFCIDEIFWIEGLSYDLFAAYAEEKQEVMLENRIINMAVNGVLITVSGLIPAEATLQVEAIPLGQQVKERIVQMSDMVASVDDLETLDLLYSYDISILYNGEEYEPYIHDTELEVRFTHMNRNSLSNLNSLEVFHVSNQDVVEQVDVTGMSDYEVVITADEFSQYIVIGKVEHQYETHWELAYQEKTQEFTAPAKGIYKVELYGAQGSDYGSHRGGLGGMVTAYVELDKNQIIEIITGGQNSFHGGNHGTVSNGGGATELRIAGEMVAIAGGGGGAGILGEGGKGGLSTESQEIGITNRGTVSESFGGGAGYQNGQDGYVLMHKHIGDATNGGGCYTKTKYIYHSHAQKGCKYIKKRCTSTEYVSQGWWPQMEGENACHHVKCIGCGTHHTGPRDGSASYDTSSQCGSVIAEYWGCGKTENALDGVEFSLGCEKDEETVDGMVMSMGGSNFYQTQICKNVATAAGANAGNGRAVITLEEINAATIFYYESASEVMTSVSVEKGAMATYPISETPQRESDSKYSYTFVGWDDMATQGTECLQAQETVMNAVTEDRSYMAVYEKTPQSYVITLEQENADEIGIQQVVVQYGKSLPAITIPNKQNYIFAGYYTGTEGSGTRIYREDGTGEQLSYFEEDATLYAYWMAPLVVSKHPTNVTVQTDYPFAVMEAEGMLTQVSGYSLSYQWYISEREDGTDTSKLDGAVGSRCMLPTGYQVGNYYVYCEITATSAYNGQRVTRRTDIAKFTVEKGNILQNQILLKTNHVIYDGKPHTTELDTHVQSDVQIYYSNMPLTKDNYQVKGTMTPLVYTEAGTYPVYVYLTSSNYQDFAGMMTLNIEKATPTVYLANRNVAYNKKQQGIGQARVYGVNQTVLNLAVEYVYYTDENCTKLTTKENGALQEGGEPSKIGTYYVQVKVNETSNYKSTTLTQPAMFNIIATKSKFKVSGYHGVYDGKPHGLQIEVEDEDVTEFWFSNQIELTEENYQQNGTKTQYMFTKPGTYMVHYMAVTKITGRIYDYASGSVKVVIEKKSQNNGSGAGGGAEEGGTTPPSDNQNNQNDINKPAEDVIMPEIQIPEIEIPLQPQYPSVPNKESVLEQEEDEENTKKNKDKKENGNKNNKPLLDEESNKDKAGNEEMEIIIANALSDKSSVEDTEQGSNVLTIMDSLDELTPQEIELLKNYLQELHPSVQEQEEIDKSEHVRRSMAVIGMLGMLFGSLIGAGIMFAAYPFIHLLLIKRSCVKGKCVERAQAMTLSLETSKGMKKIEKNRNGTFALSELEQGETYLLKGTIRNGKTLVLMKIQPQTWNIHYECTEIAGLQIQVKERRGGLKIVIR